MQLLQKRKSIKKTKNVGEILKNLNLNVKGTGKSTLSISHDNILYKNNEK